MPTGTRSSISANSTTNPMMATVSPLMGALELLLLRCLPRNALAPSPACGGGWGRGLIVSTLLVVGPPPPPPPPPGGGGGGRGGGAPTKKPAGGAGPAPPPPPPLR